MNNVRQGDIATLVLINGAEIIGKFSGESAEHFVLNKPRMLQASQQGVGLVNGICMSGVEPDDDIRFQKSSVLFLIKTVDELSKGYQQQVSGIVLPTQGLKL